MKVGQVRRPLLFQLSYGYVREMMMVLKAAEGRELEATARSPL